MEVVCPIPPEGRACVAAKDQHYGAISLEEGEGDRVTAPQGLKSEVGSVVTDQRALVAALRLRLFGPLPGCSPTTPSRSLSPRGCRSTLGVRSSGVRARVRKRFRRSITWGLLVVRDGLAALDRTTSPSAGQRPRAPGARGTGTGAAGVSASGGGPPLPRGAGAWTPTGPAPRRRASSRSPPSAGSWSARPA